MPKIIPPEIKKQVIDNHFLGITRDENADKTGISTGAVSAILSQFSKDIGKINYEALTRYTRTLRENDMNLADSIDGFHIINSIKRLEIDSDKLEEFIVEVYLPYKDSDLSPSELVHNTKRFVEFSRSTGTAPDEIERYHNEHLSKVQELKEQIESLKNDKTSLETDIKSLFTQNKITLKQLDEFVQVQGQLKKRGVSVDNISILAKMLDAAEKNSWDITKIIRHLEEFEDYEKSLSESKLEFENINKENKKNTDEIDLLDKKITSNEQHLKKLESKIKTLKNQEIELKASISTTTTFSLNQIKTIKKKAIDYISDVQSVHLDSLNALNNNLIEKSDQVTKKQKNELEEITSNLDKFISEMIKSAENAGNLKALAPFHKILASKGEAHEIYPSMITILERFEFWYQKQDNKSTRLPSIIDELISIIKNHLNQ